MARKIIGIMFVITQYKYFYIIKYILIKLKSIIYCIRVYMYKVITVVITR